MNCRQFEWIAAELAGGRLDETARESAEAHAAECQTCGERIAAERHLTAALAELAGEDSGARPSMHVAESLRAEFVQLSVRQTPRLSALGPSAWVKFAGVAAAAVLIFWTGLRFIEEPRTTAGEGAVNTAPLSARQQASIAPRPVVEPPASATTATAEISEPASAMQSVRSEPVAKRAPDSPRPRQDPRETPPTPARREIATSFIPLTLSEPFAATDPATLVRVRLSSTALQYFGLAPEPEVSPGLVEADVLLGEDGLARAVRFVSWIPARAPVPMPAPSR